MGQRLARREVEDGLRLYTRQEYDAAVRKWKRALHRIHSRRDKFALLGYLASAHCDCGKYRDMLAYAVMQIDLANDADCSNMRAEAYLNLARSNERLCEYHKAVSYCRHSLQNQARDTRVHGFVYLCEAKAYFGFSNFAQTLRNLEQAMLIARECDDQSLELHIYITLGQLFTRLKDYEKGLTFHLKAAELAKNFKACDMGNKFQRLVHYNLSVPYRKLGKFKEAMDCCEVSQ